MKKSLGNQEPEQVKLFSYAAYSSTVIHSLIQSSCSMTQSTSQIPLTNKFPHFYKTKMQFETAQYKWLNGRHISNRY